MAGSKRNIREEDWDSILCKKTGPASPVQDR